MRKWILLIGGLLAAESFVLNAQTPNYWQQEVHYEMAIDFDVKKHQFTGNQKIKYVNNSPDTLRRLYFHLYFNAFRPGSMMDERSQYLPDPDSRISKRIGKLAPEEIGFHEMELIKMDGQAVDFDVYGTLLRIDLTSPILPGQTTTIETVFNSQVPKQVRRSGRMNDEGVDYTMTQWYPKLAAYSPRGWHTQQYVNREFFGDFGSFDVAINIDASYVLGGTGVLLNACELDARVAQVYCKEKAEKQKAKKQSWHFKAENVHDFAWAADPEFKVTHRRSTNGVDLYFLRLPDTDESSWQTLEDYTERFMVLMSEEFGQYPYPQFSVIQGGDGGMEYPMCTMILGQGGKDNMGGMIALMVHEAAHNWYYGVLGFDEQRYPWMDEGFTTYAENVVINALFKLEEINPHEGSYKAFRRLKEKRLEEPLSTPADHYCRNRTYGASAYSMGSLYLAQLEYIIGQEALRSGLREFFQLWAFKHPQPDDLLRILERRSGMQLHWFHDLWIGTTQSIDYALQQVKPHAEGSALTIKMEGDFPMPLEIQLRLKNGESRWVYVPTDLTTRSKQGNFIYAPIWPWTARNTEVILPIPFEEIEEVIIDPYAWMADIKPDNQRWPENLPKEKG